MLQPQSIKIIFISILFAHTSSPEWTMEMRGKTDCFYATIEPLLLLLYIV